MPNAVYNSSTASMGNRNRRRAPPVRILIPLVLMFAFSALSRAIDWSAPEQQLAHKVVAITGPGTVSLTIDNHSSIGRRDSDTINVGLHAALESAGLHFVKPEQGAGTVAISLSENASSYIWVAEIHLGAGESTVVMVSLPRPEGASVNLDSVPLALRKTPLWSQEERILDVAVLEQTPAPTQIAVLDTEKVSLYRMQGGKWQLQQALTLSHTRPWPRDLRGRLVLARDHLLDVYLPGVLCRSTPVAPVVLNCRESDDPWPLVVSAQTGGGANFPSFGTAASAPSSVPELGSFFAPARNFFTGALTPGVGKFTTLGKFYSAAFVPRDKYVLWLFTSVNGPVHMVDGVADSTARFKWNSDIATMRTPCGAGWQVLAVSPGNQGDSIRAYEFPDRDPVAVTQPVALSGEVTALWTESRGDTATVVTRNQETGSYEAFQLSVTCSL